jgi:hypothetical protein
MVAGKALANGCTREQPMVDGTALTDVHRKKQPMVAVQGRLKGQ